MSYVKNLRGELATAIATVKTIRAQLKAEIAIEKQVRADQKKLRAEKREANKAARVAKLEAQLLALKSIAGLKKAQRKPSKVVDLVKNGKKVAA